ncbi:unnamed protein product [Didymodactylos carnosus]|uniref:L-Fucosyltransferase n=1 Tax=Didymodactylos carnosus TaxID=1234261 RepID=A0A815J2J2_9BILA|nr:unnamed protein product [Didymodactylos carnosus]CAF4266860.1 unnamed protein product [Didymodactylos carnosus]
MFASAVGLALTHSCRLYIDKLIIDELSIPFEIDVLNMTVTETEYLNVVRFVRQLYNYCTFFPYLLKPNAIKYLELTGFWQVQGHFTTYTKEIQKQFTFRPSILARVGLFFEWQIHLRNTCFNMTNLTIIKSCIIQNTMQTYSSKNQTDKTNLTQLQLRNKLILSSYTWIGIHIRRGDFLYGRTISSTSFILDAMNLFNTKYNNRTIFVITSDEKSYCSRTFTHILNVVVTPHSFTPAEDLAILAVCQNTIVTVGTFGWWGAYLSGGVVIHDVKSPQNPTPIDNNCSKDAFFPSWFSFLNRTS